VSGHSRRRERRSSSIKVKVKSGRPAGRTTTLTLLVFFLDPFHIKSVRSPFFLFHQNRAQQQHQKKSSDVVGQIELQRLRLTVKCKNAETAEVRWRFSPIVLVMTVQHTISLCTNCKVRVLLLCCSAQHCTAQYCVTCNVVRRPVRLGES
jgi:hypothetical protein